MSGVEPPENAGTPPPGLLRLLVRSGFGGVLMGLANLVPGISGGTMLLAAGIYPRFIGAIAEISTLKFRAPSLTVLAAVGASAVLAIALLAGPVKVLVVEHRWVMYSLFIGLTLGGVPIVWGMIRRSTRGVVLGAVFGFAGMGLLGYVQSQGGGGSHASNVVYFFLAGVAGASAMILPGVSGAYLLLVLGVYIPILDAIDRFRAALSGGDTGALVDLFLNPILPVGLGVVIGIVLVSNLLQRLLRRFEKPTLGVLLGLLLGAVLGLWPFQRGRMPLVGERIEGRAVTSEWLVELAMQPDKWPTEFYSPRAVQFAGALGLVLAGFCTTVLIARLGREPSRSR